MFCVYSAKYYYLIVKNLPITILFKSAQNKARQDVLIFMSKNSMYYFYFCGKKVKTKYLLSNVISYRCIDFICC